MCVGAGDAKLHLYVTSLQAKCLLSHKRGVGGKGWRCEDGAALTFVWRDRLLGKTWPAIFQKAGCRPACIRSIRLMVIPRRFIFRSRTVARPVAVRPRIRSRSADHLKCCSHWSFLGLKRGTVSRESGSCPSILSRFDALQVGQAQARFSNEGLPPPAVGVIWSHSNTA